jgi:hypothetical protein
MSDSYSSLLIFRLKTFSLLSFNDSKVNAWNAISMMMAKRPQPMQVFIICEEV